MESDPSVVSDAVQVACPEPFRVCDPHPEMVVPLALNATVPLVTAVPLLVTVAVRVVEFDGAVVNDGFTLDVMVVEVAAAAALVVILRVQLVRETLVPDESVKK